MNPSRVKSPENSDLKEVLRIVGIEEKMANSFKNTERLELKEVGINFDSMERMISDITSSLKSTRTFCDAPSVNEIINLLSPIEGITMPHMDNSKFIPYANALPQLKDGFEFIKEHGKLGIEFTLSYGIPEPNIILNYIGILNTEGNALLFAETERSLTVIANLNGCVLLLDDIIKVTFK